MPALTIIKDLHGILLRLTPLQLGYNWLQPVYYDDDKTGYWDPCVLDNENTDFDEFFFDRIMIDGEIGTKPKPTQPESTTNQTKYGETRGYGIRHSGTAGGDHPKYHLGGDIFRDDDGTLCWGAKTYIKRLCDSYKLMFGDEPRRAISPLVPDDHPELDESSFLEEDDIAKYQSLIGALQWTITLCRFDIATAVMTMGRYRVAPRTGHLARVKRIDGYLKRFPTAAIRFRTHRPGHEMWEVESYDWLHSVYGKVAEEIPPGMPTPKGKHVRMTTYKDANLYHDYITGRAVTGVLHWINGTPIDWTS